MNKIFQFNTQRFCLPIVLFSMLFIYSVISLEAQSSNLVYFRGDGSLPDKIILEWETSVEDGTAGYRLRRTTLGDSSGEFIDFQYDGQLTSFVPAEGSVISGFLYEVEDTDVDVCVTYIYELFEFETSGNANMLGDSVQIKAWCDDLYFPAIFNFE